jgi:hypothetical protein
MILDLGTAQELIRVTAEYSNAVLVAVLPYVSDVAQKLDLPVPHPLTTAHVTKCAVVPIRDAGASVLIGGDWAFWFRGGYVTGFQGPRSYFALQDPDKIPAFYGTVRMSTDEAVQLARQTIKKLGIPLEAVFAEQEPRLTTPPRRGTNTVPHYHIEWLDPRTDVVPCVDMEVDADSKRVERMRINSESLRRPPPEIGVAPQPAAANRKWPPVNPAYAWRLLPIVLQAVDDYGKTLSLPIPRPLTTNHVARFSLADNRGWPHSELELTNGWRFIYRNSMVNGFYAPDNLFNSDRRVILIKQFLSKWRMPEAEAIELVRRTLARLSYSTNLVHTDFKPTIQKPAVPGIARYSIWWWYKTDPGADDLQSKVEAEVDADRGELKSLYYDDKSYWNHPPPINVPISLAPPRATNHPPAGPPGRQLLKRPPSRPQSVFNAPVPR